MQFQPDPIPAHGPISIERRSTPRLRTSNEPARIAWKAGGLRMRTAPARLIDITTHGAGLVAHRPGELGQLVWLGVLSLPGEWVKATIRAAIRNGSQWKYHLAFCEPCPAGLLEEAVHGARSIRSSARCLVFEDDDDGF
jgi:hypothetical protein